MLIIIIFDEEMIKTKKKIVKKIASRNLFFVGLFDDLNRL
jgi:hypothetical protein